MSGIINISAGGLGDPSYGSFRASEFVFTTSATHKIITSCPTIDPLDAISTNFYVVFIQLATEVLGSIQVKEVVSMIGAPLAYPIVFTKIITLPGIQVDSLATAQAIVANINTQMEAYYNDL